MKMNSKHANSRLYLDNRYSLIPKSKSSQSETVGFVLIILIVGVIVMIFLWFLFTGKPMDDYTSTDMSDLLISSMLYTTNCSTTFIPEYKSGQELVKECHKNAGELCIDGRTVCKALNDTIRTTIAQVLDVSEDSPIKAFSLNITYYVKGSSIPREKVLPTYSQGNFKNCSSSYGGYSSIYSQPGYIEVKLQVCKGRRGEE